MTWSPAPRHAVIERHLLMAQRCNTQAEQFYWQGQTEAAQRQRQLLAVFLHNALAQLPQAGAHTREVLREAGMADAQIEALLASGAARTGALA